ncbi:TonB-dependent receptor [marine gamma proteobacterium HTCC2143]|uniref:TonB-dependent receptor n=1 Tax=marine gamma proteobacterium HTCC2143 TaxID=247633 RepID=A0Y9J3_9GAMM|nr:TonB-dependent receptor [marine gamma proteobacterium HTCC2143]
MLFKSPFECKTLLLPLSVLFAVTPLAAIADHTDPEELLVVASQDRRQIDVADTVEITADSATLLRKAPGANVNGNGPLTGIPQYRGMYGDRINIEVNGTTLSSGGPNWMDPPLSYAPAAQLESLEIYRGIAPVSAGQETIGGAINAKTWSGDFSSSDAIVSSGRVRFGGQSVNNGSLASAAVVAANRQHRVKVSALTEQADDAEFADGDIVPSEYNRQRYDIGYGFKNNGHTLQVDVGRNETNGTGTAALPMDIQYIDSDLGSIRYQLQRDDWSVSAKVYYSDIEHGMTNYELRPAPAMAAMRRRNIATGDNFGFNVVTELNDEHGAWRFGIDAHGEEHNSNIDNPNAPMFFVTAFNDAQRDIFGVFAERSYTFNKQWLGEFGLRYNRVEMDADEVDGTPAMMPAGMMLRDNFNKAQRQRNDDNVDWVAKIYYQADKNASYSLGAARKTRSASYQERYLWLPLQATGGLADGRTYTGNLDLDPEVAHEIELGVDYQQGPLRFSPRLFYRDVNNYIQGTQSSDLAAMMFVNMMNAMNGTSNQAPLQFNNVDAEFYGVDMDWSYTIDERWSVSGIVNYVRAKRDDVSDNLYRIAPLNGVVALNYLKNDWSLTIESMLYAKQNKISETNSEQETSGYGLLNVKGYWQLNSEWRLGFGVDNLLDKKYQDHLAGYNRAGSNAGIANGARLPGYGRNMFARVDYQW